MAGASKKAAQVSGSAPPNTPPAGRPFQKGQPSANPGGQPKWVRALQAQLRTASEDGARLVGSVIRGEPIEFELDGVTSTMTPALPERLRATEISLSYTLPKPSQKLELEVQTALSRIERALADDPETLEKVLQALAADEE